MIQCVCLVRIDFKASDLPCSIGLPRFCFAIIQGDHHITFSSSDPGHCWQLISPNVAFPYDCAIRAGTDADGSPLYAGRAFHEGNLIPAKVLPHNNVAYVSHGGEEVAKDSYEVLRNGSFVWEFATNGEFVIVH